MSSLHEKCKEAIKVTEAPIVRYVRPPWHGGFAGFYRDRRSAWTSTPDLLTQSLDYGFIGPADIYSDDVPRNIQGKVCVSISIGDRQRSARAYFHTSSIDQRSRLTVLPTHDADVADYKRAAEIHAFKRNTDTIDEDFW